MQTIVYNLPTFPETALSYSRRASVPLLRECPVLPPFAQTDPNDCWNNLLCGADDPFYIPYERGDVIPIQFNVPDNYHADPSILTHGFKDSLGGNYYVIAELQGADGLPITDNADDLAVSYYVSYIERYGSFQTLFLNTTLLDESLECWRIKFTFLAIDPISMLEVVDLEIWTEYYQPVNPCRESVAITSTYSVTDCFGNYYREFENFLGTDNPPYYNFMRLNGEVEFTGDTEDITENDRKFPIAKDITENYRVTAGIIPPYYAKRLSQVVRGSEVKVEGVTYQNFEYSKDNDDSREFYIELTFDKICRLGDEFCDL